MDGLIDTLEYVLKAVPCGHHVENRSRLALGQQLFDFRQCRKRLFEGYQVPCIGRAELDTADEPLEIVYCAERCPEFGPKLVLVFELRCRIEPVLDLARIHERIQEPLSQFSPSHGGDGEVEHGEQRPFG